MEVNVRANTNYIEINIRELFSMLLKKSWIIILSVSISAGIVGYYSYARLTDYYKAEATIFLGKEGLSASIDLGMISLNNQLISDYINLMNSRLVAEEVIKRMGVDIPPEIIQNGIYAYSSSEGKLSTRMFRVSYQSTNPQFAADVVNHSCDIIIEKADSIFGVKNAQIIDRALVPKAPIGPNRSRNVIIAAAVGAVIGIIVIFILEFLNYTFKNPEDLERITGLTVLGTIPKFKGENRKEKHK